MYRGTQEDAASPRPDNLSTDDIGEENAAAPPAIPRTTSEQTVAPSAIARSASERTVAPSDIPRSASHPSGFRSKVVTRSLRRQVRRD
jgi:hypothetical protein